MASSSDVGRKDPSVVGTSGYVRNALDFYPTPRPAFDSLLEVYADDFPAYLGWEPFCGNGAISTPLGEHTRGMLSTDIRAYEGFDADALVDFFSIRRDDDADRPGDDVDGAQQGLFMGDIEAIKGFRPDLIVTNPPYGKLAEQAARHALHLMEPETGIVMFLCRHEWDAAAGRRDLFDHPAFACKLTLRRRPRWIEGTTGAPRFPYAWFVWDWTKALTAPHTRPELRYV